MTKVFRIHEIGSRELIDSIHAEENQKPVQNHLNYNGANNFRDVHVYDNQGADIKLQHIEDPLELKAKFNSLIRLLKAPEAGAMIHTIYARGNFDGINRVNSQDLLYHIITHYITTDLFYMLEEQLTDNYRLGQCPQGSSWRLRQVYYAQLDVDNKIPQNIRQPVCLKDGSFSVEC